MGVPTVKNVHGERERAYNWGVYFQAI